MADWKFVVAEVNGGDDIAALQAARSRQVTFRRNAANDAGFTIDGHDPGLRSINQLQNDLVVYRDKLAMFRGRIGPSDDSMDATNHTTQISALDYRGLLEQIRMVNTPLTFTGDSKREIVAGLLGHTQGLPGGNFNITMGALGPAPTGTHDREYPTKKKIGEAITELGESLTSAYRYDWWVDPQMRLQMVSPTRGVTRNFVVEVGRNTASASRGVNTQNYGNVVIGTGDEETTTEYIAAVPDIASRIEGRWERTMQDHDLKVQATLEDRTDAALVDYEILRPAYGFTLDLETAWDPEKLWVGDTCKIVMRSGWLDVVISERIEEIQVTVTDDDEEKVQVTFGERRRAELAELIRRQGARLHNLERR